MTDADNILEYNYRRLAGSIILRALTDWKCVLKKEKLVRTTSPSEGTLFFDGTPYPKEYFEVELNEQGKPKGLTKEQKFTWFAELEEATSKHYVKELRKFLRKNAYPEGELILFFHSDWFKELSTFIGFKITIQDILNISPEGKISWGDYGKSGRLKR